MRGHKEAVSANIRFDLSDETDCRAWSYLQGRDKRQYRSYSKAVIAAVNDFFARQEKLTLDPYLETREKEDAFLQRVLETVERGIGCASSQPISVGAVDVLAQLLQGVSTQRTTTVESATQAAQESQAAQAEAEAAALDFLDNF